MITNNLSFSKTNNVNIKTNGKVLYEFYRAMKKIACYNCYINRKKYQKNFIKIKRLAHKLFYVLSPFQLRTYTKKKKER